MNKKSRFLFDGILTCFALVLSYLESLIPYTFAVPGIKLGLPNLAIVFILYRLSFKDAMLVSWVRVMLVSLLFGNLYSFFLASAGAVTSIFLMIALKKCRKFHIVTVSIAGGVMHNLAQIFMAMVLFQMDALWYYLPVLFVAGIVSGVIIGLLAATLVKRIPQKMIG